MHTFRPGPLPVGFILEKDYGPDIVDGRYEQFLGCRIGGLDFSVGAEGFLAATVNVRGAKALPPADAPLDAALADLGHTPFSAFAVTVEEGGAPIATIRNFTMRLENELDDGSFAIGSQGVRRALPAGRLSVRGDVESIFESIALYEKAIAGTDSSLRVKAQNGNGDGSAGNELLDILIEHLQYAPQSPAIDGPAGVVQTLPYSMFKSGADLGITVTLKNAISDLIVA